MLDRNDFRGMSDTALAEWHMLTNEVTQLRAQVLALTAERDAAIANFQQLGGECPPGYANFKSSFEDMTAQRDEQRSRADRAEAKLEILKTIVPDFCMNFILAYEHISDAGLTEEAREMRRDAREVIMLLGAEPT